MNHSFQEAQQQKARQPQLLREQDALEQQFQQHAIQCKTLKEQLHKAQKAFEKIDGKSLVSFFHGFLGNKEGKLEEKKVQLSKAQQEYDQATAKWQEIYDRLEQIGEEQAKADQAVQYYYRILRDKEEEIIQGQHPQTEELRQLGSATKELEHWIATWKEGYHQGRYLWQALGSLQNTLGSAKNYGIWDLIGGGFLATSAKYSEIDTAKRKAFRAQQLLQQYAETLELRLPSADLQQTLHSSDFMTIGDYIFDNPIFDSLSLNKIYRSANKVENLKNKVECRQAKLLENIEFANEQLHQVRAKREQILEAALGEL